MIYGPSGPFGVFMKPSSRSPVNKYSSAKKFDRQSSRTKGANFAPAPMRGGWRM